VKKLRVPSENSRFVEVTTKFPSVFSKVAKLVTYPIHASLALIFLERCHHLCNDGFRGFKRASQKLLLKDPSGSVSFSKILYSVRDTYMQPPRALCQRKHLGNALKKY
jgi:hypothetical protein